MIQYKKELVEKKLFESFTCDRCNKEITDVLELQETLSINFIGGYESTFGDGYHINCDLCQDCLYELIKDYYRIVN